MKIISFDGFNFEIEGKTITFHDALFGQLITLPCPTFDLEGSLFQHLQDIYYKPLQQFVLFFERAFNDNSYKDFGASGVEKDFLMCIPKDFPEISEVENKRDRFKLHVEWFRQTFNKYYQTNLSLEMVLPYIIHCKEWNY